MSRSSSAARDDELSARERGVECELHQIVEQLRDARVRLELISRRYADASTNRTVGRLDLSTELRRDCGSTTGVMIQKSHLSIAVGDENRSAVGRDPGHSSRLEDDVIDPEVAGVGVECLEGGDSHGEADGAVREEGRGLTL